MTSTYTVAKFKVALGRPSIETEDRADAIELGITQVADLNTEPNTRSTILCAGLVWSIYRRDAA